MQVVGVSYDSPDVLKKFAKARKISFPLLSDPESKMIVSYSLKNKETVGKSYGKINLDGVPYPGTVLVDQKGIVRAKLFVEGYRDRHSVDELIAAAKELK